jgi:hypothetical protein
MYVNYTYIYMFLSLVKIILNEIILVEINQKMNNFSLVIEFKSVIITCEFNT